MDVQKDVKNPDGSLRFNVSEINAIPIGGYALQLISMLVFAWLSSRTGKRATWIVVQMVRYTFFTSTHLFSSSYPCLSHTRTYHSYNRGAAVERFTDHNAGRIDHTLDLASFIRTKDVWVLYAMAK